MVEHNNAVPPPPEPITEIETFNSLRVLNPDTNDWEFAWWNVFTIKGENKNAAINIATAADHTIIAAAAGKKIIITSLILTAAGEVNITLKEGGTALSGAMDFGGSGQPGGMVSNFATAGLELSISQPFIITLSDAIQVSGIVCYKTK